MNAPWAAWWRRAAAGLAASLIAASLAGCDRRPAAPPAVSKPAPAAAAPFTILAGSELRELEPALKAAGQQAGVAVALSYAGTLDIVERINAGERFDAILPPNGAYPMLALDRKPVAREKLFYSRVALGVKPAVEKSLGWDKTPPTWLAIAKAAKSGKFSFAMTNPTASNTGMSALFAVASAAARKTEDLSVKEVDAAVLKDFLSGQRITAGSSGWLADAYLKDPQAVDGIVNYEAVILRLNEKLPADQRLALVYPTDGVISADYPLLLLDEARRADYLRLVAALKALPFQKEALQAAFLRPSNPDAPAAAALPNRPVAELSFPNRLEVIDEVLSAYQGQWRRPATSIFVLDVSGSMQGQRIEGMRAALNVLAGADATTQTARYSRFQTRERVLLLTFSDAVSAPVLVDFADGAVERGRQQVLDFSAAMRADGATAIFSALERALALAAEERQRDPQRFVSVVLLTDGENNRGVSFDDFVRRYDHKSSLRVFPILFGEGNATQMAKLAELTGGRTFDARQAALASVFKEIRGYQ